MHLRTADYRNPAVYFFTTLGSHSNEVPSFVVTTVRNQCPATTRGAEESCARDTRRIYRGICDDLLQHPSYCNTTKFARRNRAKNTVLPSSDPLNLHNLMRPRLVRTEKRTTDRVCLLSCEPHHLTQLVPIFILMLSGWAIALAAKPIPAAVHRARATHFIISASSASCSGREAQE